MDRGKITEQVIKIVAEQLGLEEAQINEDSNFVDDLNADSLDRVEMVLAFEEDFGFEIDSDDAESIATVKDAVEYIHKHLEDSESS